MTYSIGYFAIAAWYATRAPCFLETTTGTCLGGSRSRAVDILIDGMFLCGRHPLENAWTQLEAPIDMSIPLTKMPQICLYGSSVFSSANSVFVVTFQPLIDLKRFSRCRRRLRCHQTPNVARRSDLFSQDILVSAKTCPEADCWCSGFACIFP